MGKKFNYCASESSYTDAKSSGEFTEQDLAFVKGDTTCGILKTRGMTVGMREIGFAGAFNYGTDYIEATNNVTADSKLYFLSALGKFGYGTVSQYGNNNSPVVLFKFTGVVSGSYITANKTKFEDMCRIEDGNLYPLDNTVYVINDRRGIKYAIHEDNANHFRAKPLFELKAGDCLLLDGTPCLKQDAITNHMDDIFGIIVDPVRKTMILNNGRSQIAQSGTFANFSGSEAVIKPLRNQLAGIDNCVDYDRLFANLTYAIGGDSRFSSYFPVFYTARFGNYIDKKWRWYLATEYEKVFIRDNEDIQEVLTALGAGTYAISPYSATPKYEYNENVETYMNSKTGGIDMQMYVRESSITTYYNYLVLYV